MRVFETNQYDKIERCILAYPSYLQKADYKITHEIDLMIASIQYNSLLNVLIENGIKPYFLDLDGSPSQLFTRDIGFVINDLLFISNMKQSERQPEIKLIKEFVKKHNLKYYIMQSNVEGGDIIAHNDKVFIGQGDRTNEDAFIEIGNVLKTNNMHLQLLKVYFETSKIHLDCAFNIIDKDTCIISKEVFNYEDVIKHFSKVIEIEAEDLEFLAPNVINMGNKNLLCSSENFSKVLQSNGYNTSFIQFDQIIKDKGSLGCCVFPILRT